MIRVEEPVVAAGMCIFCRKRPDVDVSPWCTDHPGRGCTYGLDHEVFRPPVIVKQDKRIDKKLCTKCGMHPKNPASATSACAHEYEAT